jgi:hypothetical protein
LREVRAFSIIRGRSFEAASGKVVIGSKALRSFYMLVALAATVTAGPAVAAKDKAGKPKERKICRTVEMPGRITPQKICRKVERPAAQEENQRSERNPGEPAKSGD